MSPPLRAKRACDDVQHELHALLLDAVHPSGPAEELWEHLAACDRCARALAHDRAMRCALERLRGKSSAPESLSQQLRRELTARGESRARREGGPDST